MTPATEGLDVIPERSQKRKPTLTSCRLISQDNKTTYTKRSEVGSRSPVEVSLYEAVDGVMMEVCGSSRTADQRVAVHPEALRR